MLRLVLVVLFSVAVCRAVPDIKEQVEAAGVETTDEWNDFLGLNDMMDCRIETLQSDPYGLYRHRQAYHTRLWELWLYSELVIGNGTTPLAELVNECKTPMSKPFICHNDTRLYDAVVENVYSKCQSWFDGFGYQTSVKGKRAFMRERVAEIPNFKVRFSLCIASLIEHGGLEPYDPYAERPERPEPPSLCALIGSSRRFRDAMFEFTRTYYLIVGQSDKDFTHFMREESRPDPDDGKLYVGNQIYHIDAHACLHTDVAPDHVFPCAMAKIDFVNRTLADALLPAVTNATHPLRPEMYVSKILFPQKLPDLHAAPTNDTVIREINARINLKSDL